MGRGEAGRLGRMVDLTPLIKFFELAPRYLAVVGLSAGFVLYAGPETLEGLGLAQFAQDYRPWLGGVFVVSAAICVVETFRWGKGVVSKRLEFYTREREKQRRAEFVQERLHALTEDEKEVLRFYIWNETRANMLKMNDGVVCGLISEGIIYRASPLVSPIAPVAHNITETAWRYLNEKPYLLEGSTGSARTDCDDFTLM